ncbi:hypothetical protein MTQ12_00850 [Brevibacterium sp. R8603A2]|uniref:hypothetical protein n=1 Tax=Brevibacterium sp. R8603A2 TaxID=2929779 RepID=UPI001FF896DE|nr:hypothetical protein [Brevibacterium sp. R8603A2]MCK1801608.1 hypothetical protein [Brevibacterium sp. R8603A2]
MDVVSASALLEALVRTPFSTGDMCQAGVDRDRGGAEAVRIAVDHRGSSFTAWHKTHPGVPGSAGEGRILRDLFVCARGGSGHGLDAHLRVGRTIDLHLHGYAHGDHDRFRAGGGAAGLRSAGIGAGTIAYLELLP